MKILVISDTHKDLTKARDIINRIRSKIDLVIHLGDHDSDAEQLKYEFENLVIEYVPGNCDWCSFEKSQKIINVRGKKILMTHGHNYGVKYSSDNLKKVAREQGARIVLFGHTHIPYISVEEKLLTMNPGSISLPRGGSNYSYGIINIDEMGQVEGSLVDYINYKKELQKRC